MLEYWGSARANVRGEGFAVLESHRKGFRQGSGRIEAVEGVVGPLEEAAGEGREIRDGGHGVVAVACGFRDKRQETLLHGERVAVQYDLGVGERGGGHDQAFLLDIAEPGFVIADGGVGGHLFLAAKERKERREIEEQHGQGSCQGGGGALAADVLFDLELVGAEVDEEAVFEPGGFQVAE